MPNPRKLTPSPLEGAAPSLNPTARPLAIPIGATPAPNRSQLMELGEAFRDFHPELRDMLRDAAAREERDALALGELEAQRTQAATKMAEVEGILKEAVDSGAVSPVRSPAFQRGFRLRVGKDLAQSVFQEKLLKRLPETLKVEGRTDPEQIITDTYAEVSQQIHADDFFARAAFDDVAQGVIAGFRQRSAEGYTAEYKRAAEQKIADEGSELLFQLAAAPEEDAPKLRDSIRGHLDYIRNELPKSEVNGFYVKSVIAPAIDKLVSEHKFTEARQLMDEMDRLDVTGSGGMLSQTSIAKAAFSDMRAKIERETREAEFDSYRRLKREREMVVEGGEVEAASALNELRLSGDGKLTPSDRFRLIDEFRKANPNDPLKVQGFAAAVHREFDGEERWRSDPRKIADLELSITSLKKDDLDAARARLDALYNLGEIPPSERVRLAQKIDKLAALYGALDEGDYKQFAADLYAYRPPSDMAGVAGRVINFGDLSNDGSGNSPSRTLWDGLSGAQQTDHQLRVTQFFTEALQAEVRSIGDPLKIPAEKAGAIGRATVKAREFARTLLGELHAQKRAADTEAAVHAQAAARKLAAARAAVQARLSPIVTKPPVSVGAVEDLPGVAPKIDAELMTKLQAERTKPPAERDVVSLPLKARGWIQVFGIEDRKIVSLSALAELAKVEGAGGQPVADAKDAYAYAKGLLGFTPEEVSAGETRHGVRFEPTQIDPTRTTVFRNRIELEKHWNNGNPTELFMAVGNAIDPENKMDTRGFYQSQSILFSAKANR